VTTPSKTTRDRAPGAIAEKAKTPITMMVPGPGRTNSLAAVAALMRVDALPDDVFHPAYDDGMWRRWRQDHLDFINQLLPTLNEIPASLLQELAELAIT
jgi:hypothetical protein